jgi:hypothetical protein
MAAGGAPALPWRAVGLSALLAAGAAALVLPALAVRTGGWIVRGDGMAYFLYARALVLQGDADPTAGYRQLDARLPTDLEGPMAALRFSARRFDAGRGERVVLPWPIGAGLAMAPFFAAGWGAELLAARAAGRAPDSFGLLPQVACGAGAVAYGLLGFWASYLTCRRLAAAGAAAGAALGLILASPAAFYIFLHPAMAHAPSLGLAALLVLLWWRAWESAGAPGLPASVALGGLAGLLVLIRYQNVVFALLPLALLPRLARRRGAAAAAGFAAAIAAAAAVPLALAAVLLWRGGDPLLGAAGDGTAAAGGLTVAQNRFDLASPHFFDVLLSCQHGAFYWTPVLALGAAALAWAAVRHGWARPLAAVLAASVYLVGCLVGGTNWSGDNAFGMRYLVESVPLLAPPLAWAIAASRPAAPGGARQGWQGAWALALLLLVAGNGLLMLAFARRTVAHDGCVTWGQMAAGAARALAPAAAAPPDGSAR